MPLTVGTDTYITVADATTYLETMYLSTDTKLVAWKALAEADHEVLLRKAAQVIEQLPLVGYKATKTQDMAFPRVTATKTGHTYAWHQSDDIPEAVARAQAEIAINLTNTNSADSKRIELQRQGVTSFSLGDLSETYGAGAGVQAAVASHTALQLLAPWTGGGYRI